MFALAIGMTLVLLTCAEGGYVKFVEFVANKCLGYYGVNDGVEKSKRGVKVVGWNEYVMRLPRRNRMEGDVVVVEEEDDDESAKIVLDSKTMLFHQQHSAKKKVARGRGK